MILHPSRHLRSRPVSFRLVLSLGLVAACVAGLPAASHAQSARLDGSWSGGGPVVFASGAREQARCRVQYKRATRTSFSVRGVCATASGRASQVATIHRIGNNRYQGRFYNSEYGISGTISVVVRGSSQSVHLTSESGYASLRLTR